MMVISAIMLISMIVLEFVFTSNVNYNIALNERQRLQAYYLAESALSLMKVEIKMDKQVKSQLASLPIAANLPIDLSQPMCQQFPFSTTLLRNFFVGGTLPLMAEGNETVAEGAEVAAEGEAGAEKGASVTTFETESAQEFLAFDGDFDGTCVDEASKINLNYFWALDPAQQTLAGVSQYDTYKTMIVNFLKQERFKKLFEGIAPEKIKEVVGNIADWADKNDLINEFGYTTRGSEESLYKGDEMQKPRNAKFLTLDEVHFVEGVDDTWFMPLEEMFTVYGDSKINVCLAEDDIVWALILSYANQNQSITPIDPRNTEARKKLLDAVKLNCTSAQPQASKIAADLDAALGITSGEQQQSSGGFANFITTEPRFYSLKLTGQVGETVVNIKTVLDIKDSDPKKWKMLYYKVY